MLNASGLQADIIIARSTHLLDERRKEKLSLFCNVPASRIISAPDVDSIYDIPDNFEKEGLSDILCDLLFLTCSSGKSESGKSWEQFIRRAHAPVGEVKIAVIGKYFDTGDFVLADSYISVIEAIRHAAIHFSRKPVLTWINSVTYEQNPEKLSELSQFDGIIVPGGFGARGVEGIISAIQYAACGDRIRSACCWTPWSYDARDQQRR